jgi:hypothetical protein
MKKIYYILTFLLCVYVQTANAQMGVNSTGAEPATSSILDVSSSTKGFLMPRMTTTQRDAIVSPANGLMIYNTSIGELQVYEGGWKILSRANAPLAMSGNSNVGIIQAYNSGTGQGLYGYSATGFGVLGSSGGTSTGVKGTSTSGSGLEGVSTSGYGVSGISTSNYALYGFAGSNHALYAEINGGTVAAARIVNNNGTGNAIYANNNSSTNAAGRFVNNNVNGDASRFEVTNGTGVFANATGTGNGVDGEANSGYGGYFRSVSGTGLAAISSSSYGIYAENSSATIPVALFANISGGTGLEVIASTALKLTGAIKVAGGSSAPAFKITTNTAGGGNTSGNVLKIPNTTLANNANDILLVTHNYSPTNTYLNKAHGVFWDGTNWNIYLEDFLSAMPNNIVFNVLVIKQ